MSAPDHSQLMPQPTRGYADMTWQRVGPWMQLEMHVREAAACMGWQASCKVVFGYDLDLASLHVSFSHVL